jgi:glycosyltransferase involved in cell wall biosynthesis
MGFARRIAAAIGDIRARHLGSPCILFFSCLFEQDFDLACQVVNRTDLPWSFLYLHPYRFAEPSSEQYVTASTARRVLQHRNLVGIATMNEHVVERLSRFSGKPVITFPEITDQRMQPDHAAARRFRQFAQARTMVVTAGYLGAWKGVGWLARVCLAANPDRFAFLFAGPMALETYRKEDREVVERCLDSAPHALFHLARVPDGEPYNALFQAADVIFAAFENFPFSSNTLTKAALLRKPVIVSEGGLSAARVREFRLGAVVPFGDVDAVLGAIETFATEECRRAFEESARWRDYLELHGAARLEESFGAVFRAVWQ